MINVLIKIAGAKVKSLRFLFLIVLSQTVVFSQSVPSSISNLDQFYSLVDSASNLLVRDLGNAKKVKLELDLGIDYSIFSNQIRGKLLRNDIEIVTENSSNENVVNVNFIIDDSFVGYNEPERDGLFGDFFTERTLKLSGNYFLSNRTPLVEFNLTKKDTINVEDVEKFENRSYPFTQGDLPPEPFFSSLLEPIVAIGAVAVTVILFFSVRSK